MCSPTFFPRLRRRLIPPSNFERAIILVLTAMPTIGTNYTNHRSNYGPIQPEFSKRRLHPI
jgi:hypothetical protein